MIIRDFAGCPVGRQLGTCGVISGLPVMHPQRQVQWNLTQCIVDLSIRENGFGRIPANTQTIEREPAAA
jgi:hypothetical protein